jgi:hypothetical protein
MVMIKKLGSISLLILLAANVVFADSFPAGSVAVTLPSAGATSATVTARHVLSALKVADSVLAAAGFVRGQMGLQTANGSSGYVAVFKRDMSVGNPTQCNVLLQNNRLIFSFVASGVPSPSSAQLSDALANALRNQFGAAAVEVQLK